MAASHGPVVGDWYLTAGGDSFEVVAFEPDEESIEIQYFDGSLEELDLEMWLELGAQTCDPPEDWSGSLDVAREDFAADDLHRFSGGSPLDDLDL